ncbi:MAG: hypothetical protein AAGK37_10870 [Pseudomonadota bacterium]
MRLAISTLAILALAQSASAEGVNFDGFSFKDAEREFASRVVAFRPGSPAATENSFLDPSNATGVPNYKSRKGAVSLGNGGVLVVAFDETPLRPGGDSSPDLVVFEVGSDEEASLIAISADGEQFFDVGRIEQGTVGVDIDEPLSVLGLPPQEYRYVRITDEAGGNGRRGKTAGADIDALGVLVPAVAAPEADGQVANLSEPTQEEGEPVAANSVAEDGTSLAAPFGAGQVGHYATFRDPAESIRVQQPVFQEELQVVLERAAATWLPESLILDLYFDPAKQGEDVRSAFLENGRSLERCSAVLQSTDGGESLVLGRSDCPPALGVEIPNAGLTKADRSGVRNLYVRLEFNGDERILGGGEVYADLLLAPTHFPNLHTLLSRTYAGSNMPLGNGFDLAGMRLDQTFQALQEQANRVIEEPANEWTERANVSPWGARAWGVQLNGARRDWVSSSPGRGSFEDLVRETAKTLMDHQGDGRARFYSTYWINARLEQPEIKSEVRMSVRPPVAEDVLIDPEEFIQLDSVETENGERRAFKIARTWAPFGDNQPLGDTVRSQVIDKYGEPTFEQWGEMTWRFDLNGQHVSDCTTTDLAKAAGQLGQKIESLGCVVEMTARISTLPSGLLAALKMSLYDARLSGADIVSDQWITLRDDAQTRVDALLTDAGLDKRDLEMKALEERGSKL